MSPGYLKSFRADSGFEARLLEVIRKDPELNISQLCERFGVSVSKIRPILRRHGIKPGDSFDGIAFITRGKWK